MEALLLVDLQNDFFPGNPLGTPNANEIFPLANQIQDYFKLIIASKDWHPKNHKSFAENHPAHKIFDVVELNGLPQILWPIHCVQETKGAEFHPQLRTDKISKIIYKGIDADIDSYSAFFDNMRHRSTGLDLYLHDQNVKHLYILGLATDYCVQYTVLDAIQLGFKTSVILDGCFGINKNPGDAQAAIETMKKAGAIMINSHNIIKTLTFS